MKTSDQIALVALIVTSVLSIAAIVISLLSYLGARKHADRSATAAEEALALQRAEAEKYEPRWPITWVSDQRYSIHNGCGERCEEVEISSPARLVDLQVPDVLEPDEGGSFLVSGGLGVADTSITVRWRRSKTGETFSRRYPLPPKY